MIKINRPLTYVLVLVGGLLLSGVVAQAASAEKQLQKGIEAYRKNDNDKAMDYFVDVLMHGDREQAARASNYIDAIHNHIGGIETPVEVDMSFPDQPTQTVVDPANNLANYGTERLNTLATEAEAAVQETADGFDQVPQTLTEQIEARQLAGYLQENSAQVQSAGGVQEPQAIPAASGIALDQSAAQAQSAVNGAVQTQQDMRALDQEFSQEEIPADRNAALTTSYAPIQMPTVPETQTASSTFMDLTSDSAIAARSLYSTQKIQSMTEAAEAALRDTPGVHLYMRADGQPDAIDIDEGVLFQGTSFRPEAFTTLNHIYELLALTQGARYTILPSGSYADDVTLSGIRQAMALQSYLIKRGISQGKLSYNMGLVDEDVPAKFSNLKGLSVVLDYDAKLPTRLLDNEEKETKPLLSMAIVPQCHAIDRSLGEAYAVDFSVLETVNPLDNWMLQVVLHGRDGKYYIVRQLEGFAPVYHQILWNGRKGIIGPELPCGKYTLVLTAMDVKGNKQVVRRRVIVKCAADTPTGSCQAGACPAAKTTSQNTVLDYKSARLWKKPGRIMRDAQAEVLETQTAQTVGSSQTQAVSTAAADNTYTHTKTVRNIVTNDNTPAETVSSTSYVSEEYGPAADYATTQTRSVSNPYDMPYEDEYTAY